MGEFDFLSGDGEGGGDGPTGTDDAAPGSSSGLWISRDDGWYDAGEPVLDTDGDGVADSVSVRVDGAITLFTDTDRDGIADVSHQVRADGEFATWTFTPADGWILVDRGRLG